MKFIGSQWFARGPDNGSSTRMHRYRMKIGPVMFALRRENSNHRHRLMGISWIAYPIRRFLFFILASEVLFKRISYKNAAKPKLICTKLNRNEKSEKWKFTSQCTTCKRNGIRKKTASHTADYRIYTHSNSASERWRFWDNMDVFFSRCCCCCCVKCISRTTSTKWIALGFLSFGIVFTCQDVVRAIKLGSRLAFLTRSLFIRYGSDGGCLFFFFAMHTPCATNKIPWFVFMTLCFSVFSSCASHFLIWTCFLRLHRQLNQSFNNECVSCIH